MSGVPRRQGSDAVTRSLPLLSLRPKPRASQSWTFGQGAVAPGFGSDDTAQGGLLSHRGTYRGQQWAAPLTWPALPLWAREPGTGGDLSRACWDQVSLMPTTSSWMFGTRISRLHLPATPYTAQEIPEA